MRWMPSSHVITCSGLRRQFWFASWTKQHRVCMRRKIVHTPIITCDEWTLWLPPANLEPLYPIRPAASSFAHSVPWSRHPNPIFSSEQNFSQCFCGDPRGTREWYCSSRKRLHQMSLCSQDYMEVPNPPVRERCDKRGEESRAAMEDQALYMLYSKKSQCLEIWLTDNIRCKLLYFCCTLSFIFSINYPSAFSILMNKSLNLGDELFSRSLNPRWLPV